MSRRIITTAALLCLGLAGSASAETLKFRLKQWNTYDSNVFNVSGEPQSDYVFRFAPSFELDRAHGALNYNIRGEVRHERFLHLNGQSAWDYSLFARASYRLTSRTSIYANNTFFLTHSLSRRSIIDDSGTVPVNEVEFGRPRIKSNALTFGINHNFAGGWSSNAAATWSVYESNRQTDFQSQTLSATASANYVISGSDRVGFGVSARTTDFEQEDSFQANSGSQSFNAFGTWFHAFGARSSLFVRGRPDLHRPGVPADGDVAQWARDPLLQFRRRLRLRLLGLQRDRQRHRPAALPELQHRPVDPVRQRHAGSPVPALQCQQHHVERAGFLRGLRRHAHLLRPDHVHADLDALAGQSQLQPPDSQNTGVARTTLIDQITGKLAWIPGERWEVNWTAIVSKQTSATTTQGLANVGQSSGLAGFAGAYQNTGLVEREIKDGLDVPELFRPHERQLQADAQHPSLCGGHLPEAGVDGSVFRQALDNDNYRIAIGFRYDFPADPFLIS